MPLFYQHNIDADTLLAIWKIEEKEAFFLDRVQLTKNIRHPYKRLQHLAGRYLLTIIQPDFPLEAVKVGPSNKPFIRDMPISFSISHCGNYAAAIVSKTHQVGVDIELETPRLLAIAERFLSARELHFLNEWQLFPHLHIQLLTMIWSAKEAIFKWHGMGQVDFKKHIQLETSVAALASGEYVLPFLFTKEGKEQSLKVHARIFQPLVLTWLAA